MPQELLAVSEAREKELNARALDPAASVVIEACAGSGKTWMLVSRIVRLLLDGAAPSQILAITFTRKAAQEMATRLRDWLYELATADDDTARKFLLDRAVPRNEVEALLPKARQLYERFLTAQPPITIATFHSWFLQLLRRAPLDAGAPGDVGLLEQTSSLVGDAWEAFASRAQHDPASPAARGLDRLFGECGLDNTRRLLARFLHRRADWLAYTRGQADPVAFALGQIRGGMSVAPDADVIGALLADIALGREIAEYAALLDRNTATDKRFAALLTAENPDATRRFEAICSAVLTEKGDLRSRKPSDAQARRVGAAGEARLLELHAKIGARLVEARVELAEQASYRFNEAALACGVALLEAYQHVKAERQVIDYADIEWRAWELLSESEHAVYMHYKLDARYRHVLLDEFQDTNPLQWLTLRSWLEAAAAAELKPTVFMVGDPKQSIYRFRRAETRLFAQAADYLRAEFKAVRLPQDESRRCPPPVIEAVNRVFAGEPAFEGFEKHVAHFSGKPGRVEVLPLVQAEPAAEEGAAGVLRNPLERPLADREDRRREREAELLVAKIGEMHGRWEVATDLEGSKTRPAGYGDIMVLVRRRTHLETYERALRRAGIPFVTSRQGGLLDTLEARDLVALLEFLVSPFADLKLAHALRSPVFDCSDDDLVAIASAGGGENEGTWWERLQRVAVSGASPGLARARELLERWLGRTDSAPVHDQLDRIYFEGDVMRRYEAAVPPAMRGAVRANLQAFMQRALDVDSGRYPSLPRFLHELADLREAPPEEAPDEGVGGEAGNAVRIYTVHGAKGLQAPIVWILDAAAGQDAGRGYEALVDWPPEAQAPRAFTLWPRKDAQSAAQKRIAEDEARLSAREDLNLLYVAMTRAQQVLIVSGSDGRGADKSWHARLATALGAGGVLGDDLATQKSDNNQIFKSDLPLREPVSPKLALALPTGARAPALAGRGLEYGTHFHRLMDRLTRGGAAPDRAALAAESGLAAREFDAMWAQAQALVAAPALARYFDPACHRGAANEVAYVNADGELRRIDRLVEFDDEVCVLDYKSGAADAALAAQYDAQLADYREAAGLLYPGKTVRSLIVFSDGTTSEG